MRSVGLGQFGRHVERLVGDTEHRFGACDVFSAERQTVCRVAVGVVGRGEADVGPQYEQGGSTIAVTGGKERRLKRVEVLADVAEFDHPPPVGVEPGAHVVIAGESGAAVDCDSIVVEYTDQSIETEMAGE